MKFKLIYRKKLKNPNNNNRNINKKNKNWIKKLIIFKYNFKKLKIKFFKYYQINVRRKSYIMLDKYNKK